MDEDVQSSFYDEFWQTFQDDSHREENEFNFHMDRECLFPKPKMKRKILWASLHNLYAKGVKYVAMDDSRVYITIYQNKLLPIVWVPRVSWHKCCCMSLFATLLLNICCYK